MEATYNAAGRTWQLDFSGRLGLDLAELARRDPAEIRRLFDPENRAMLAELLPVLSRGPEGEAGASDPELLAWALDPKTGPDLPGLADLIALNLGIEAIELPEAPELPEAAPRPRPWWRRLLARVGAGR